ncbi:collectin-10 [Elysia marginata]|uniref:Collectin-10 n=1 Tax=Elysia marginata TaxID=1093978 RepID=A0AAV4JYX3_9GAST|nr:collectin-10 [Elysia marginata]
MSIIVLCGLTTNHTLLEALCSPQALYIAGPTYLSIFNNTCYFFVTYHPVVYEDALRHCHYDGGSLAMPKTKPVNDFLIQEMRKRGYYKPMWIGMHSKAKGGSWRWEDGSKVVPWGNMNWLNGFGLAEHCMALNSRDGQWHDMRCSAWFLNDELPYICQYADQVYS